jgi:hypothetical protein
MNQTEHAIDFNRMGGSDMISYTLYPIEFHRGARDRQLRSFDTVSAGMSFHGLGAQSGRGDAYRLGWQNREEAERELRV